MTSSRSPPEATLLVVTSSMLPIWVISAISSQSRRRCGSAGCHCHKGEGHVSWTLTFMVERKKRVEHVPNELVELVQRGVEEGNTYKNEVAELMALNAQLLILERRAHKQQQAAGRRRVGR